LANAPIPAPENCASALPGHAHAVQFYEDDGFLLDRVAEYCYPVLAAGGAAVILALKMHRDGVAQRLKARGLDVTKLVAEDRLIRLDARELKEAICRNGSVDQSRFVELAGGAIRRAATARNGRRRQVAVFGELVAVLWQEGKRDAAIQLEGYWNDLQQKLSFSLLCAYPMSLFSRRGHAEGLEYVCATHAQVIPAEDFSALAGEEQRQRAITRLQQKARALEIEARVNEQRMDMVQGIAGVGTWEMDLTDESIALSNHAQRMLGLGSARRTSVDDLLGVMYYSGDRDVFRAALKKARTGRKEFSAEFRVKVGTQVRVLTADGKVYYNTGQPLLLGVISDVTDARSSVA
jgi:hypothetical protein